MLLESIVAISLISVVMAAFTSFFVNGIAITNHERARQAASQVANSAVETIRSLPASDLVAGTNTVAAIAASQTVNNIVYTVTDVLSMCVVTGAVDGSSNCGGPATGRYLRAAVGVTWRDSSCQAASCTPFAFTTSTLLSPGDDPTFNLGQVRPPPTVSQVDQTSTIGETVSLDMGVGATGVPPLTYAVTGGGLPAGLVMPSTGLITGSPTTIGSRTMVTVTVTDGASNAGGVRTGSVTFYWTVVGPPTVTAPPNQVSTINTPATNVTIARTCPHAPCTFTMTNGPVGLTIDNAGVISGTPTVAGTVTVTVTITDGGGISATSATFTWAVLAPASVCVPTSALPNGSFEAPAGLSGAPNWLTGGSSPVLWDTTEPDNILELWGNGGNAQSANGGVPITAQQGTQWAELNANEVGALYQDLATVPGQVLQWSVWHRARAVGGSTAGKDVMQVQIGSTTSQSPQVPTGQVTAMISDDASAWVLYQGVYTVPVSQTTTRFQFAAISTASGSKSIGNFIDSLALNNYIACLTNPVLPQKSTVNTAITPLQLSASRGSGNYLWGTTASNPLPAGLSISAGGLITGTPTVTGIYTVVLTLTDTDTTFEQSVALTWTVYAPPTVTSPGNQTSTLGDTLNMQLATTCPNSPCAYVLNSGPSGLGVSSSGVVYGTVTGTAQTYGSVSVTATDGAGATANGATFTWTVSPTLSITAPGNQTATKGTAVTTLVLTASGGAGTPDTWSDPNGTLPAGLSIATVSNQGAVTGTPTTVGTYPVQLTVKDSGNAHTSTVSFTWTVAAAPALVAINPGSQVSTLNRAIIPVQMSASGGSGSYVWSGGGGLPAGLSMTSAGRITGTPTAVATPSVTLTVTDTPAGYTQNVTFTWTVYARPTITNPGNQSTANNTAINLALSKSCPNTPCSYTLNGAPAGLSVTTAGVITGTVTSAAQTFAGVTVTVTDQAGASATTAAFTWAITTPLAGRWAFDEASGTNAADTGGTHPTTLSGTYGRTTTAIQGANALTLGGTSGAATTSGAVLDTSKSFTVAGWVKLTNVTGSQTFFSQDGTTVSGFYVQLRAGKFAFVRYASDSTAGVAVASATDAAVAAQWYHLAGVYNGTAGTLSMYVNGALQQTVSAPTAWNATGSFVIGRGKFSGVAADWVSGAIDDVRAYSGALSSDAVAQIAQAGYWNLDEGSGTSAADGSLNNYTGTLGSGATWAADVVGPSATQFNGASTAVITTAPQVVDTSQSYSVSAWAKADVSASGTNRTVASIDGVNNAGFRLQQRGGTWAFVTAPSDANVAGASAMTYALSTSPLVVGQWYHLVGVYDNVAKTITLYVNGVKQGASVSYTTAFKATGNFVIGRGQYNGAPGDYWIGAIDNVIAVEFPLDQTAVTAMAASAPPTPATPTASAGAASATVNWTAPADIAGSPVTGYVITPYLNGAAQATRTYNTSATTQSLSGLTTGAAYTFTVAAVNSNATSAPSGRSAAVVPT